MAERRSIARTLFRSRKVGLGLCVLAGFLVLALFGPWLVGDPHALVDAPYSEPSLAHLLGTNGEGQDVLAHTLLGARTTLLVAFAVGALVTLLGALIGISAGYMGGVLDDVLSTLTNVFLVIPGLPLAIVIAAYLPPGPVATTLVLVFAGWAWNARLFRAQALALRSRDFVLAAQVVGESKLRIMLVEMLPNLASLVGSAFVSTTVYALGAEVGLEFLGLGDLGTITWGTSLYWAANDATLLTGAWWAFLPPGLCVATVGFALTLVGYGLDEITNPVLRSRAETSREPRPALVPAPTAHTAGLRVEDLVVDYRSPHGWVRAVDGVSFEVAPGEIFGLAGESGSGKSTIGQAVLRLREEVACVRRGAIVFEGVDLLSLDDAKLRELRGARIAAVFQSALDCLNPVLPIREQIVDAMLAHTDVERPFALAKAREMLELVGVPAHALDDYPHQLSGGMRQRVVIAIALALEPRLVIMDEPTTALDVVVQRQILERILGLRERFGFSVLFISHDLPLLLALCDRVGILQQGKLVEVGPVKRLRSRPRHAYTQRLLDAFPQLSGFRLVETIAGGESVASIEAPSSRAPLLELEGLRKSFGTRRGTRSVLSDVSLSIERGEIVALVGQSGSGKSTIARILLGLEGADAGELRLHGRVLEPRDQHALGYRRRVQLVLQDPFASLNPTQTVRHHLARPLLVHGFAKPDELDARIKALLAVVGLETSDAFLARHPHALSGGQRQRVAIARALAVGPELIVADEPTSMLDVSIRRDVLGLFRRLVKERGISVLLVTHDLASARDVADRVLVLEHGTIVEQGRASEVLGKPQHPYTQLLLSSVVEPDTVLSAS